MLHVREYEQWTALEMAELARTGQVSADELRETCLTLIAQRDPLIHAVAELNPTGPSVARGPLAGVPFAVKELLAVPGLRWTMGSRLFAGNPAGEPTPYAKALLAAGLQIVCSTTSSELGLLGSTESLLHGPTVNPWRAGLSPAGSSGGAAALVAAGMMPMSHASDAGGSIRVPASVTGLFGFKPSKGRTVDATPSEGLGALVEDHCVSRSVADSAALLAVTERRDATATWPAIGRVDGPASRRLRVGVVERTLVGEAPDAAVRDELARVRRLCEALGHETMDVDLAAVDGPAVSDGFFTLAGLSIAAMADAIAPMLGRQPGPDELEPFTLELIEHARSLPADARDTATKALRGAADAYVRQFEVCDAVLSPTLPRAPWRIGLLDPRLGREELIRRTESLVGYTPIHNVSGSPAMSVPLGWVDGLPVGMQFAAAPGDDDLLLELAFELEAAEPWRHHRPDVAALIAA